MELLRNSRTTDTLSAAKSAEFLFRLAPPAAACALLRNSRTTDTLSAAKSAEFLFRLAPPAAACALLRNSRTTDTLSAAKSAEFLFRLAPPAAACALLRNSRTTDTLSAAKSAEFLFRLAPPAAACALLRVWERERERMKSWKDAATGLIIGLAIPPLAAISYFYFGLAPVATQSKPMPLEGFLANKALSARIQREAPASAPFE